MRRVLQLHPDSRCEAVTRIEVWATRLERDTLKLNYKVKGDVAGIALPQESGQLRSRADGLWRHTCFEAFVRLARGTGYGAAYLELNFSTSIQWAAYRFKDERRGGSEAWDIGLGLLGITNKRTGFSLQATARNLPKCRWKIALAAVIEEKNGRLSYWALAHPPGEPDFHHSTGFMLELA